MGDAQQPFNVRCQRGRSRAVLTSSLDVAASTGIDRAAAVFELSGARAICTSVRKNEH